jgi:hypothetical protein
MPDGRERRLGSLAIFTAIRRALCRMYAGAVSLCIQRSISLIEIKNGLHAAAAKRTVAARWGPTSCFVRTRFSPKRVEGSRRGVAVPATLHV